MLGRLRASSAAAESFWNVAAHVPEDVHQAAAHCESSVGLAQRTMYASAVLPSFATLATPEEHPLSGLFTAVTSAAFANAWKKSICSFAEFLLGV